MLTNLRMELFQALTGTALARRGHGAHLWATIGARDTFTLLIGPEVASTQPSGVRAITLST